MALYLFNDHLVLFRVKAAKSEGTPAPLKLDTIWALSKGTLAAEAADGATDSPLPFSLSSFLSALT